MFDVIVIGGGPAGYIAAINCSKNGMKTGCVETSKLLGGSCLNVGCIPSKTLLEISHKFSEFSNCHNEGIMVSKPQINVEQMMSVKTRRLQTLAGGIDTLFKKNKVERIFGLASFIDSNTIAVANDKFSAKKFIIATGSVPNVFSDFIIDEKNVCTSTGILSLTEVPKKMVVIGGGYIGLELGCVWSRLGSEVMVMEGGNKIMPSMDDEISSKSLQIFEKQSISFMFNQNINKVYSKNNKAIIETNEKMFELDVVLVATGRKPNTQGLNLENAGLKVNSKGFIDVDKKYKTLADNIYAIGDVIGGAMLAHKAEHEAIAVAENLIGKFGHVNYDVIPGIVYTSPEIASIGKNEQELKNSGIDYKIGKSSMVANSRSQAIGKTEGFAKILACKKTDRVLGAHIIGCEAGSVIHEIAVLMEFNGSAQDIAMICHGHPTFNEAVKEAALNII